MPVYEYVCRRCSAQFEELVFDGRTPQCPTCSAADVEKVLSVVSVGKSDHVPSPEACGGCAGEGRCPYSQ
jgi:putative FmdB family regulatory protein